MNTLTIIELSLRESFNHIFMPLEGFCLSNTFFWGKEKKFM